MLAIVRTFVRTHALPLAILVLAVATLMGKRYSITGGVKAELYRVDSLTGAVDICMPRHVKGGYLVRYEVVCGITDLKPEYTVADTSR